MSKLTKRAKRYGHTDEPTLIIEKLRFAFNIEKLCFKRALFLTLKLKIFHPHYI